MDALVRALVAHMAPHAGEDVVDYVLSLASSRVGAARRSRDVREVLERVQAATRQLGADPDRVRAVARRLERSRSFEHLECVDSIGSERDSLLVLLAPPRRERGEAGASRISNRPRG